MATGISAITAGHEQVRPCAGHRLIRSKAERNGAGGKVRQIDEGVEKVLPMVNEAEHGGRHRGRSGKGQQYMPVCLTHGGTIEVGDVWKRVRQDLLPNLGVVPVRNPDDVLLPNPNAGVCLLEVGNHLAPQRVILISAKVGEPQRTVVVAAGVLMCVGVGQKPPCNCKDRD